MGILKAFQNIAAAGSGGFKVVASGIAAALVATAAGLLVAIYAVIAYNYFVSKVTHIGLQYKLYCEEFLLALGDLDRGRRGRTKQERPRRRKTGRTTEGPGEVKRAPESEAMSKPRNLGLTSIDTFLETTPMGMNIQLDDGSGDEDGGNESVVAEINITPLTDVFLVLLIIFMVSTTAMVENQSSKRSGVKVALPKASAQSQVERLKSAPILSLTQDGKIFIGRKEVDADNLEAEIASALKDAESTVLLIRGDTNALLGQAVELIGTAKKQGPKMFNF